MSFQPNPGDELLINGKRYIVGSHPAAPGIAYAQAGRQGIVYQLLAPNGELHEAKALKVFFPKFRIPSMVYQSEHMEAYGKIPGLQVCKRDVLTPERNGDLIAAQPDLLYAVLMPWVHGMTWFDCITEQRVLTPSESLALAKSLAGIGSSMEQRGLAHCDLSAPNVMLPFFSEVDLPDERSPVELVDVEQMYSTKLDRPDALLAGSPGYAAHRTVSSGLWSGYADRFAGAVIIAEMMGWSDAIVVEKAWGESYFDQHEMQSPSERYHILKKSLQTRWGTKVSELFERAWDSQDLSSCPTFGEWLVMLSSLRMENYTSSVSPRPTSEKNQVAATKSSDEPALPYSVAEQQSQSETAAPYATERGEQATEARAVAGSPAGKMMSVEDLSEEAKAALSGLNSSEIRGDKGVMNRLFDEARQLEEQNKLGAALEIYRSLYHFTEDGSPLQVEIQAAIDGLEAELNPPSVEKPKTSAWYKSKKVMITSAAVAVLLVASIPTVQILADRDHAKQLEAAAQLEQAAKEEEQRRQAEEAARIQAEADNQAKEAQLAVLKQQEEEEQQRLQVEADLKAKEAAEAEEKQRKLTETDKQALQEKYDRQAKYEAYLAWKKERDAKAAQEKAAAEARKKQLAAERKANVIELINIYNKAYSSQEGGRTDKAKTFAKQFLQIYNQDPSYYKSVGEVGYRANSIYNFLGNSDYRLPKI
ncbi:hypothetical protein D3C74_01850 [compost metagenome]